MPLLPFPARHIFPLAIMTSITFMSFPAYFNTPYAIQELFGLPERIAKSPHAQSPFVLMTARIQAIGIMLWVFYLKGEFGAVDTVMGVLGTWVTMFDVWVCWREGVKGKALFRGISGGLVGIWGLLGLTKVGCMFMCLDKRY